MDHLKALCYYPRIACWSIAWLPLAAIPGELPYKSDGDARRLALGYKLQILASLRVFGIESHYNCTFRYRLVLCIKKFTKKCADTDLTEISLSGQFKLEPHPHWSPLWGLIWIFRQSIPVSFIWECPPLPLLGQPCCWYKRDEVEQSSLP